MENHKELVSTLYKCMIECISCSSACSKEKEPEMLAKCIKLDRDCEEICILAVSYLKRDSENLDSILKVCSQICEVCAAECEKHNYMQHCKRCAEMCRTCAEACHQPA